MGAKQCGITARRGGDLDELSDPLNPSSEEAVISRKQNNTVVPGIAGLEGHFHKLNVSAEHIQALSQRLYASLSLQGQWSAENLDASQKMTFGGAQNLRAYQPGILSGDNGLWVRMELTRQWAHEQLGPIPPSQLAASLFLESAWLEVYRRPWSSVTDNQAKLSGTGVRLSWAGPHQWSASLSFGRALGKTPSLLSGSTSLHTSAWLELVRKFK